LSAVHKEKLKRIIYYFLFIEFRRGNHLLKVEDSFIKKYHNEARVKKILDESKVTLEEVGNIVNHEMDAMETAIRYFIFYEWKLLSREELNYESNYTNITALLKKIQNNFFDHYQEIIQDSELMNSIQFFLKNQSLSQFLMFFLKENSKSVLEVREKLKELVLPLVYELLEPLKKVNDSLIDILKSINDLFMNLTSEAVRNMLKNLGVDIYSELISTVSDYVDLIGIDPVLETEITEIALDEAEKFKRHSINKAKSITEELFSRYYQNYISEQLKSSNLFAKESGYKEIRQNIVDQLNNLLAFYHPEQYEELSQNIYETTIQNLMKELMEDCFLNTKEKICVDFSRVIISGEQKTNIKKEITSIVSSQQAFYKEMVMLDKRTQSLSKRIDNTFLNNELIAPKNIVFGQKVMDVMDPIKYSAVAMLSKSGWALNAKMLKIICDSNGSVALEPMWVYSNEKVAVLDLVYLNNASNFSLIHMIDNWNLKKPGNSSDEKLAVAVFLLYGIFFLGQNVDVYIKEQMMNLFKKLDLPTDLILMTRKVEKDFMKLYKEHSGRNK